MVTPMRASEMCFWARTHARNKMHISYDFIHIFHIHTFVVGHISGNIKVYLSLYYLRLLLLFLLNFLLANTPSLDLPRTILMDLTLQNRHPISAFFPRFLVFKRTSTPLSIILDRRDFYPHMFSQGYCSGDRKIHCFQYCNIID